ncbi:hypothetical protein ED562_19965 [Microcystis aeruginosa FACHB-524]|nr:hypothetical protein ED562_19965 [Microcystis aeruginosa FACHB-524]
MCPLCLEWFLPLPRQQGCILEYILPTKSKRAISLPNPFTVAFSKSARVPHINKQFKFAGSLSSNPDISQFC